MHQGRMFDRARSCGHFALAIPAFLLIASVVAAQARPDSRQRTRTPRESARAVDRIGPDEIEQAMTRVRGASRGIVFPGARDEGAQYVYNRRTSPTHVEAHAEWDDILVFQGGAGSVYYGGEWRDAQPIYQGERRGGSLANPHALAVGPGDVVRIPAGEPHRIVPLGDEPLVYLVVKVRRALVQKRAGR